jgi:chromosome segregation ATPase
MRENDLRRTEEERSTHRVAAKQKAKEVEQLSAALQGKDGELQQERAALGEARSQIALKDTTLTDAQVHAERERMALEDAQARLTQAEQKAQEVVGLANALKEKSNALAAVEGQLGEERTARESAESQLQIAHEEFGGVRNMLLERDTSICQLQKDVDAARAALETEKMRAEGKLRSSAPLVFLKSFRGLTFVVMLQSFKRARRILQRRCGFSRSPTTKPRASSRTWRPLLSMCVASSRGRGSVLG